MSPSQRKLQRKSNRTEKKNKIMAMKPRMKKKTMMRGGGKVKPPKKMMRGPAGAGGKTGARKTRK